MEADVGWRIANAFDWQPQRLVRSSSTCTVAPYAEGVGGQSERAYTKPASRRPTNARQHAVVEKVLDRTASRINIYSFFSDIRNNYSRYLKKYFGYPKIRMYFGYPQFYCGYQK